MRIGSICFTTLLAFAFTGCQSMPTANQMKSADYGKVPDPEKSINWAKQKIQSNLLDPYSADIKCKSPRKGAANFKLENHYGYLMECTVNAKNAFGGYTGAQERYFWIRD